MKSLLIALGASLLLLPAHSTDWPQFRGPNGSAIAPGDEPGPVEFGPDKNVRWSTPIPSGVSSPIISGNRVFLDGYDKDQQRLELLCLNRADGAVLWRRALPVDQVEKCHEVSSPASATPVTDGKRVYAYYGSHGMVAYDFEGKLVWDRQLPTPVVFMDQGSASSPVVVGGNVLIDLPLGTNSHLLALKCSDGSEAWKYPRGEDSGGYSTPVVWQEDGAERLGVYNGGLFTAHDPKTGVEIWRTGKMPLSSIPTPTVSGGVVYLAGTGIMGGRDNVVAFPSFEELLAKYDTNKDSKISTDELPDTLLAINRGASGAGDVSLKFGLTMGSEGKARTFNKEEWTKELEGWTSFFKSDGMKSGTAALKIGGKGDMTGTNVLWAESKGIPEVPSPLFYHDRLYYIRNGGLFTCRDAKTGKSLYDERIGAPGAYYSSPVGAGGRIYTASDRGVVTVLKAGDTFEKVTQTDLKEPISATPPVLGGVLYVRTDRRLYAFGR